MRQQADNVLSYCQPTPLQEDNIEVNQAVACRALPAARPLHLTSPRQPTHALSPEQLAARVMGVPWQRLGDAGVITLV
jgi:hypothetical protein